ncbi:protein COFACTOR ASSEMBLY OF COMPLEX C SUBUNIT B CCB1, chloroplastic [Quercus robur]|uniref:Cofactor assembly of complex C subunit B n=1 Tax=Quercus lobata TaxID=97700 RepID=A0A7N2KZ75_QUELO|nr:protein COFACTOR ASSEMBLY OF COMPLEX C SUBUNIT B CCB1, chloroplastic [Quercus lobata]XP_050270630.1 protein COFACTOR ASSEMBLY OF COMPLEX C SUBUNIT B CCB1, chloroplastic [Quercus robur]
MAAKILSSHPHPLTSLSLPSSNRDFFTHHHKPWLRPAWNPTRPKRLLLRVSLQDPHVLSSSSSALVEQLHHLYHHNPSSLILLADTASYSLASYYTSLGLFVISVPGLWSLIKRSVKSKIVQKTFIGEGEGKKAPNFVAGEILSFFTRNNFVVTDRGETITFEGMMVPSRGQAALLTFCTCISMASVALVLTITVPDFGNNWFWLTILSPLAGAYYWKRASRKEQIKVKLMVAEDGTLSEIVVQGDDQQVEQMRKELQLSEKGMVYVKGIFER